MIYQYGNYTHADREGAVVMDQTPLESEIGEFYAIRTRVTIDGRLDAATPAALTTALAGLEAAYSVNGFDWKFFLEDGVTPTQHVLLTGTAMGGVRVVGGVSYPKGTGAEYSTFRHYRIVLEADYPATSAGLIIMSFSEEVDVGGFGLPETIHLPVIEGPFPKQETTETSLYTATQAGSAKGLRGWPQPPPPLWFDHIKGAPRAKRRTPRYRSNVGWEYVTTWNYNYESSENVFTRGPTTLAEFKSINP